MTTLRRFSAAAIAVATTAVVAVPASATAAPAKQDGAQMREVCLKSVYVKKRPGVLFAGTVSKGEKVEVTRYTRSRRYARVVARRPGFTVRGWVPVAGLCAKGKSAEYAKTSRYSVKIANSPAGGDPGFLYVGGPANITVKDNQRAGQTLTLCITPAPEQQPSCRTGRTGRTIDTIVWSKAGATEVRISIDGGPVLVDTVYPYAIAPQPAAR